MVPKKGTKVPETDEREYARAIARALRAELGPTHQATKIVQAWTGVSERSAKNWLGGTKGPNGWHLAQLVRESRFVAEAFFRLAGRDAYVTACDLTAARDVLAQALSRLDAALAAPPDP
jgi:hypothetical protein